ncbi:hypothetical protein [Streptomyces ehimensis]|uniref:Uncharacterized protein n=1 Tax=Streptomyces ehimensis TaxID=68195 RepID=A0ABV9BD67_9ACTN
MTLAIATEVLHQLHHLAGPYAVTAASLHLARTVVHDLSLIWLTRGCDPLERALIVAAAQAASKPSWRTRVRHLWSRRR